MNTTATSRDTALVLWQGWAELWNGDLPQAEQILSVGFTVNAAIVGVDSGAVQGAQRGRLGRPAEQGSSRRSSMLAAKTETEWSACGPRCTASIPASSTPSRSRSPSAT